MIRKKITGFFLIAGWVVIGSLSIHAENDTARIARNYAIDGMVIPAHVMKRISATYP